jgi:hypothetical protein
MLTQKSGAWSAWRSRGVRSGRYARALHVLRQAAIERRFRAEVLRLLTGKGLISQEVVAKLLSWRHSGFSVHGDVKVPGREAAARLGRYMIRCPVVVERMSLDEDTGEVIYRTRPSRVDHLEGPVARWDVYELIARVLDHVPAPNQQMVRYWGFYSNVARGKRRATARSIAAGLDPDDELSGTGVITVSPVTDDESYRHRLLSRPLLDVHRLISRARPHRGDRRGCGPLTSRLTLDRKAVAHPSVDRVLYRLGVSAKPRPIFRVLDANGTVSECRFQESGRRVP